MQKVKHFIFYVKILLKLKLACTNNLQFIYKQFTINIQTIYLIYADYHHYRLVLILVGRLGAIKHVQNMRFISRFTNS